MKIRQILDSKGTDVVTVRPDSSATMAAQLMRSHGIGTVVVSSDGSKVEGLLSERDIVAAVASKQGWLAHTTVRDLMHKRPETCEPDATIRDVMALMTRTQSRHVPVVENGELRGLVSIGDMVKHRLEETELESRVLRDTYLAGH